MRRAMVAVTTLLSMNCDDVSGWMDGWTDGWVDGLVDGRIDGWWVGGRMDAWTRVCVCESEGLGGRVGEWEAGW